MKSSKTYFLLLSFLVTQELVAIFIRAVPIDHKNREEVENLIDSEESDSIDDIFADSDSKIRYFDYIEPTIAKSIAKTTTRSKSATDSLQQRGLNIDKNGENKDDGGGGGGGTTVIIIVVAIVAVIVVCGVIAAFVFLRKSPKGEDFGKEDSVKSLTDASDTNKAKASKTKANVNTLRTASIQTVASDSGLPLHEKAANRAAKKSPAVPKQKASATALAKAKK